MFNKEYIIRIKWADIAKGLAVSPFAVVLLFGLIYLPWDSPSAPAWVQAIGSIGAILGAYVIANRQHQVAEQRLENERKERESALSKRLAFFALEFKQVLTEVVQGSWGMGIQEADQKAALIFESMLMRLNSSFDDDLNAERTALMFEFRVIIAGLIFTLKNTNAIDPEDRDEVITKYRGLASNLLKQCTEHGKIHHF